jgi:assimilatory nitrate reductase catalytic subunit
VVWPVGQSVASLQSLFTDGHQETGEWLEYTNPNTQQIRLAYIDNQKLALAVYLHPKPESISCDWLATTLVNNDELSDLERMAILVGSPANVEDKGEIVCSCFQIGSKQIEKAVAGGVCTVEGLGAKLKCGTNCGSCLPELKHFIPIITELSA